MAKLDRYVNEMESLLDTLRIEYNSIEVQRHDNIPTLLKDKIYDQNFQFARNGFKKAFGWEISQSNKVFYACKKTSKGVIFIEVEIR